MTDARVVKTWRTVDACLASARRRLTRAVPDQLDRVTADLQQSDEYVKRSEFERALKAIAPLGRRYGCRGGFWRDLERAALAMELDGPAAEFRLAHMASLGAASSIDLAVQSALVTVDRLGARAQRVFEIVLGLASLLLGILLAVLSLWILHRDLTEGAASITRALLTFVVIGFLSYIAGLLGVRLVRGRSGAPQGLLVPPFLVRAFSLVASMVDARNLLSPYRSRPEETSFGADTLRLATQAEARAGRAGRAGREKRERR